MGRIRKTFLSVAIVSAMTIGLGVNASAATLTDSQMMKTETNLSKDDTNDKDYKEGEIIIMYRELEPTCELASADIDMSDTYVFEDVYINDIINDERADKGAFDESSAELASATDNIRISLVKSDVYTTNELLAMYKKKPGVIKAERNYKYTVKDEDYTGYQWALDNNGQNGGVSGFDVNPDKVNGMIVAGQKEKVIAIVDTGVDYTHPDLQTVMWNNPFPANKLKGEHGYDIVNNDADPIDDNGHGTHCAGIMLGAAGDGAGISGVAQSENIKLMALKVLDENGEAYGMEMIGAYNYIYRAQKLGVNIVSVNNSWGGGGDSEDMIFEKLINLVGDAGALSVCAAGNESSNNDDAPVFPANIDSPYIISVAAVNGNGELASFSNYGKDSVDIAAPGSDILSNVSYDCFNPTIYSASKRAGLCGTFYDFENSELPQYQLSFENNEMATVLISDEAYFGNGKGHSLKVELKGLEQDNVYSIMIPYESVKSNTPVYASAMVKLVDNNEPGDGLFELLLGDSAAILSETKLNEDGTCNFNDDNMNEIGGGYAGNYWNHLTGMFANKISKEEKRGLVIQVMAAADGDYELYIDNLAISKNDVESSAFGKFDFYNGTSMAAPYVTGAVAAMSNAFPDEDAITLKGEILSCSRKMDSLKGLVSTEGVLDFSMLDTPRIMITSISLNKDKNISIKGVKLADSTVKINGTAVTPISISDNEIVIDGKNWYNKKLTVELSRNDDINVQKVYLPMGNELSSSEDIIGIIEGDEIVTDGKNVYCIGDNGLISMTTMPDYFIGDDYFTVVAESNNIPKEEIVPGVNDDIVPGMEWSMLSVEYDKTVFGDEYATYIDYAIYRDSNSVCLSSGIYQVLVFDAGFTSTRVLAKFTVGEGWSKVADIPESFGEYNNMILGAYNGKIYIMGGLNKENLAFSKDVYAFDLLTNKWNKSSALPEGRAFGKAIQIGNKLVLTLGCCDNTGTMPANLIFDGVTWKKSAQKISGMDTEKYYCFELVDNAYSEKVIEYYDCNIGIAKNSVMYLGENADNLGNIFSYNIITDKYEKSDYSISDDMINKDSTYRGTVVGNIGIFLMNAQDGSFLTKMYYFEVESGLIKANVECGDATFLEGPCSYWQPSDIICLTPVADSGFYIKSFKINGKSIAPDKDGNYTFVDVAYKYTNGINIEVITRELISCVEVPERVEINPGKSYKVIPQVYPDYYNAKNFTWKSSNRKYVKVSSNGVIKVSKYAKPGLRATVTLTAKDPNGVSAKISVRVPSLPKKNSKVTVDGITYKVTKSSKTKGTVTVISNKQYKKLTRLTIPETVKIKGYTFKVTGIGKKAFASCSKLKNITIKSKSITSIGKNAFAGINKKATITVPKKLKKKYTKLLKNSGYKLATH